MAKRRIFDFSTAYAQLILLVFLPISFLAVVGTVLVFRETSNAARVEQQAKADIALSHYETQMLALSDSLAKLQANFPPALPPSPTDTQNSMVNDKAGAKPPKKTKPLTPQQQAEINQTLKTTFQNLEQDRRVLGVSILNLAGQPLFSLGNIALENIADTQLLIKPAAVKTGLPPATPPQGNTPYAKLVQHFELSDMPMDSDIGTLYARKVVIADEPLWLLVNIDDEPLAIARLQILLALAMTGLFTILVLLLSLNIYARRWIAPIYEMRLHLQRTNASNLYKPMPFTASGEMNQLQQDMTKTLRRLHTSFQELKNHAEQTEDDLRLAFDEMEMQNISIRNARDAAVSSSQTKSAFLANISHELRTPLNSIDGFINLLARHGENTGEALGQNGAKKGTLTDEQNLYVQTIRKSSAHLLALVNDVLDFSKIEAGKLVLDSHEFDLYASIYDVADMLSPLAAEKDLNLAVFFYDDVPRYLLGDALRVKQVVTNLVNNAIKFTDSGEVLIRVSLDDTQDDRLRISVQDTGKGVPEPQQALLFQSFSQGDPSITRQYGGTGLGLVISKQLTQLMGGKIGFENNPIILEQSTLEKSNLEKNNLEKSTLEPSLLEKSAKTLPTKKSHSQGSTFWFTLPITLSNTQQQQMLIDAPMWELPKIFAADPQKASDSENSKVSQLLVWMSHTASLQVLKGSLNQLPVTITTVNNAQLLLQALNDKATRWDWVIVDNQTHSQAGTNTLLKQIRLHYVGKLALFGYQLNLNTELLNRYQAKALYQPLDRRQLYQMLDDDNHTTLTKAMPQWQGFRVLAVDDHQPNLLVLEALLEELGIAVVTANSGYDAIDYIEQHQAVSETAVDLIFMDIQMPRMSGQEAAIQIRQLENKRQMATKNEKNTPPIPIIALTAHSLSDEKDSLLASGINDYVGKPISQTQLLQILQKWLGKNSQTFLPSNPIAKPVLPMLYFPVDTKAYPYPQVLYPIKRTQKSLALPMPTPVENVLEHTPQVAEKVIDWEDALVRAAGKPDLASNLMMLLIDSIDQEKADLAAAWQAHDRQALANIAHRILGASRYTGVPALRQASQNFEDKCLLNVQNQSAAQFIFLSAPYEQLLTALDTLKNTDLTPWSQLYYYRLKEQDMPWKMI